jgi:hypothetical protein
MREMIAQHAAVGDKGAFDGRPVVQILEPEQRADQDNRQHQQQQAVEQLIVLC